MTTSWADVQAAEPAFAKAVEERFGRFRHHVLGTLRKDGSPRLTGLEADFRSGELWLGMMPNSRKARDLLRDPRFSLHANPGPGTDMDGGDARVSGLALPVEDPETLARYAEQIGHTDPFHLFRTDVTEVVRTSVEGDEIVLRVWHPGHPLRTLRRGNDEGAVREEG
ncbi:pyridoxamine 5'-phosphate oxidase family protein [Streptomyces capparidis]